MKVTLLKKYNAFLAFLLTILGVGGACSMSGCEYGTPGMEYGTPTATFKVNGTVKNEANSVINNIRVVLFHDTTFTDANGTYQVEVENFPEDQTFPIEFEDTDAAQNGSYQSLDTTVVFQDPEFTNGDGSWYKGETSQEFNVKLKSAD